jgi:DNA-binding NarL/FixJ family response regulator
MDGAFEMSITVFLADDHRVLRDGLRALLDAEADISVIGDSANGRDAVRRIAELQPDVAVLDIAMPELNGIDAAREISETCPRTRVIMLSMHSTSEHIYRALQAGARGYVLKDAAGSEVVNAVRAVHAHHRYLSERVSDRLIDDYLDPSRTTRVGDPLARLSARERQVLQLVVEDRSTAEVADTLSLSVKSVETYRSRLMQKLGIHDLPGLVKFAIQHGLTPLE